MEGAEMDPPPYTRPSSLCLGSSGPHLAWPGPVLRLSAGMLGSVDLRRSWGKRVRRKVAEDDWVQSLEC